MDDIDNASVDDDDFYEWREGGDDAEENLPVLEPAPLDDELAPDVEEALPKADVAAEDIANVGTC